MSGNSGDNLDATLVERFRSLWETSNDAPDVFAFLKDNADAPDEQRCEVVLADQYQRWQRGLELTSEDYIERCPFLSDARQFELITEELGYLEERSDFDALTFLNRFRTILSPELLEELEQELSLPPVDPSSEPRGEQPEAPERSLEPGDRIGRYSIKRVLGHGAFGIVYLAEDTELLRDVAVKVPNAKRISRAGGIDAFLNEARVVAALDHPSIAPIYDVTKTDDGRCYLVSKFIDGGDLSQSFKTPMAPAVAARLIAIIARAAHHAHRSRIIHRDIKPANVLLDRAGNPYLVDFGLAIRDDEFGTGSEFVGTPAWMSPEQARGEGHRVDGRSDVYSLGVVLFETLTTRRPYRTSGTDELLDQIKNGDVRPPRQFDDRIPRALDRICMKALARRASERYSTALDFAEELEAFVAESSAESSGAIDTAASPRENSEATSLSTTGSSKSSTRDSQQPVANIVPRGLRSFDAGDADFFLELLPGPRDRYGLPDSLRFWASRIRQHDETFPVGLLYGPSGCGKSSFVKAGLLPQLRVDADCVYIEATQAGMESRLLKALQNLHPELTGHDLPSALTELRRGAGRPRKTLVVIDQFEQWLHSWNEDDSSELVSALRQCNGEAVQALVLVRDDFWMAATRFFREIEVALIEGDNSGAIDLFDRRHAGKVLRAFGVAFNALPADAPEVESQVQFVRLAIDGIAENDRVSPVRLALFAEMLKGREWNPATLKQLGGTSGVGIAFLEDCFGQQAPAPRRAVSKAAERLLDSLLPAPGADIRGASKTRAELQQAAEVSSNAEFDSLLQMLDQQLRLITPAESRDADSTGGVDAARYQLTHDYLVPSIRQWVAQRRSMTLSGRIRSVMVDRADQWNQMPENRLLPTWWEDVGFRLFTRSKDWNEAQQRMMSRSGRRVLLLLAGTAAVLILALFAARDINGRYRASGLHGRILNASTSELPGILREAEGYRSWLLPYLQIPEIKLSETAETTQRSRRRELHRQLAMLRLQGESSAELYDSLLRARAIDYRSINQILSNHADLPPDRFWETLTDPNALQSRRLAAASILANLNPNDDRWSDVALDTAELLTDSDPAESGFWIRELIPVRNHLSEHLVPHLGNAGLTSVKRRTAARALAGFHTDDLERLTELTLDSKGLEFAEFAPVLLEHGSSLKAALSRAETRGSSTPDSREAAARHKANIASLRIRLESETDPALFEDAKDPTTRSYLIHHYGAAGGTPGPLLKLLDPNHSAAIRSSALLALGEIPRERFSTDEFAHLCSTAERWFRNDRHSGVHSSSEWVLRRFNLHDVVDRIITELAGKPQPEGHQWYVTPAQLTMVHIEGPFEIQIGSPEDDEERFYNEAQLRRHCGRSIVMASTEVSIKLFNEFIEERRIELDKPRLPGESENAAQTEVDWPIAAAFCNWLSEREGIPPDQWCYEPNSDGKFAIGMFHAENNLQRTGYRLPTHYEWEYVARAGTTTSRYYGRGTDLLPNYAWHVANSKLMVRDVGQLKPNQWGFFDMLGNAYEWCTSRASMKTELEPIHRKLMVRDRNLYRVRGGNIIEQPRFHRACRRSFFDIEVDGENIGLRVTRTVKVYDTKSPVVTRLPEGYFENE